MFLGTKFRTLRLETSALMRSEEKRAVPFTDKKKSRRGFSQVSQQRSPMVSRSTKHDRVTIPEGEISLANNGTTTANPPKSQTLSKEKCSFQAEKGVGHFKLTKKTSISYSLPQTIRTHENPWLKDARSKKTSDSSKRWGNMVVIH